MNLQSAYPSSGTYIPSKAASKPLQGAPTKSTPQNLAPLRSPGLSPIMRVSSGEHPRASMQPRIRILLSYVEERPMTHENSSLTPHPRSTLSAESTSIRVARARITPSSWRILTASLMSWYISAPENGQPDRSARVPSKSKTANLYMIPPGTRFPSGPSEVERFNKRLCC